MLESLPAAPKLQIIKNASEKDTLMSKLASNVASDTLVSLADNLPIGFTPNRSLVQQLVTNQVPLARAAWFVRILLNEVTPSRRVKQEAATTQQQPWTDALVAELLDVDLTKEDASSRLLYLLQLIQWQVDCWQTNI